MANLDQSGVRHLITKIFNAIQDVKNNIPEPMVMVNVTYSELKALRDSNKLTPGCEYRIIDYVTTTMQENTISAGHQFDIIVTADSENTLNEIVRACNNDEVYITKFWSSMGWYESPRSFSYDGKYVLDGNVYCKYKTDDNFSGELLFDFNDKTKVYFDSEEIRFIPSYYRNEEFGYTDWTSNDIMIVGGGEFCVPFISTIDVNNNEYPEIIESIKKQYDINYFRYAGANLSAWKIWYSLDNDTERFEWADSENGKGVIYRMIDEWGNDCPYDFKNIQFRRGLCVEGGGIATKGGDEDFFAYCYTFSWEENQNVIMDASIFGNNGYLLNDEGQISGVYGNIISVYNSYDGDESGQSTKQYLNDIVFFSTYGYDGLYYGCYSNNFGNNCYSNNFGNNCSSNTFGNGCYSNTFGYECSSNTFGNNCHSNTFYHKCISNTFGYGCHSNNFGNNCSSNTFGNKCWINNFGIGCYSNTFGNECSSNTFGNYCVYNGFGNGCNTNNFGNECAYNNFGNDCSSNKFGDICTHNTFGNCCYSNKFGYEEGYCCSYNHFGNDCQSNNFGSDCTTNTFCNSCSSNTFGDNCYSNTFGDNCHSNTFGNHCYSNTFGEDCSSNKFGKFLDKNPGSYYRYIIFDNGNCKIWLNCTETTCSGKYYQNVRIGLGVNNTIGHKEIDDGNVNQSYETLYRPTNSQTLNV